MIAATCSPYNQQLLRYRHAKTKYYKQKVEEYIKGDETRIPESTAWSHFSIPDLPWTQSTFNRRYYTIRGSLEDGAETVVHLERNVESKANEPTDEEFRAVLKAHKQLMQTLQKKKDFVSMQTKQTILASGCLLDDEGVVQNQYVLEPTPQRIDRFA